MQCNALLLSESPVFFSTLQHTLQHTATHTVTRPLMCVCVVLSLPSLSLSPPPNSSLPLRATNGILYSLSLSCADTLALSPPPSPLPNEFVEESYAHFRQHILSFTHTVGPLSREHSLLLSCSLTFLFSLSQSLFLSPFLPPLLSPWAGVFN